MSSADPKTYRECSVPHPSKAALDAAMDAFFEGVRELRKKHRIRDFVCMASAVHADGDQEVDRAYALNLGSAPMELPMAAMLYGNAKKRHDELIEEAAGTRRRT